MRTNVSIDFSKVRERKRNIVREFRESTETALQETPNLELIRGDAFFCGQREIAVSGRTLNSDLIVVNTGTRTAMPPIPGLKDVGPLDSAAAMELDAAPARLAILGGGYIGIEFAQMFRRLGSDVTVLEAGSHLLPDEDDDIANEVAEIFKEDGISIKTGIKVEGAAKTGDEISIESNQGSIKSTHLLIAAGRTPNTDSLNLDAAGITINERGYISVNDKLETNVQGVYAIGDVNGGPMFTHVSYDDFRILSANLLENGNATTKGRLIPYVVFIDPQLGRVGMAEREANKLGIKYRIAKLPMSQTARGAETGETRGFMKALVSDETKEILGCAVLGVEGGELLATLQIAMMAKLPYTKIENAIFSHPTLSESLNNLFMTLG